LIDFFKTYEERRIALIFSIVNYFEIAVILSKIKIVFLLLNDKKCG